MITFEDHTTIVKMEGDANTVSEIKTALINTVYAALDSKKQTASDSKWILSLTNQIRLLGDQIKTNKKASESDSIILKMDMDASIFLETKKALIRTLSCAMDSEEHVPSDTQFVLLLIDNMQLDYDQIKTTKKSA